MSAQVNDPLIETLKQEFQDEEYRYAYQEEFSNSRMATQIKVIREQRGLKQAELAELADMKQSRISALENINYESWSVSTLRRLARALGVTFEFGFKSWGELLPEIQGFGRKTLEKPKFEDDPAFKDEPAEEAKEVERLKIAPLESTTPARQLRLASTATGAYQASFRFGAGLTGLAGETTVGRPARTHVPQTSDALVRQVR
jgi:transcriptional regulator with XRE-family HTH domain